ncbi:MAG: nucleotidyltransferase domain-containing protein [Acholeplasmataceae bacterium]|nr:nucleotidyltransferase domain-containing protein [Acholeplasmataceae bacterium]
MQKTYKNEDFVQMIQSMFPDKEIMFMYLCGSRAYGTEDEDSDYDIAVVLNQFSGYLQLKVEKADFFVYGSDYYLEKQRLSPFVPLYNRAHMDEIIGIDDRLIYLDDKYKEEYEMYKDVDFKKLLPIFLDAFIEFHQIRYKAIQKPAKMLYHLLRMRGQLENYETTGKFTLECAEPWKSYYLNYKQNWKNAVGEAYRSLIDEQFDYIKAYARKEHDK